MATVIGILGGIASGKSLVADLLHELGAIVLDADQMGHQVLREPDVIDELVQRWGTQVVDEAGEVLRGAVAEIVFSPDGQEELRFLESLTHPLIAAKLKEQMRELAAEQPDAVMILDAPVMLKAGWNRLCDKILFIDVPRNIRWERAKGRGWGEHDFDAREASQESLHTKRQLADVVIDNSGTPERTAEQIRKFWSDHL